MNHSTVHAMRQELTELKARFFGEVGNIMEDVNAGVAFRRVFEKRCVLRSYDGRELPGGEQFSCQRGRRFYMVSITEMMMLRNRGVVLADGEEYVCRVEKEVVYRTGGSIVFVDRLFPIYIFWMIVIQDTKFKVILEESESFSSITETEVVGCLAIIKAEVNKFWPGSFPEMTAEARAA